MGFGEFKKSFWENFQQTIDHNQFLGQVHHKINVQKIPNRYVMYH